MQTLPDQTELEDFVANWEYEGYKIETTFETGKQGFMCTVWIYDPSMDEHSYWETFEVYETAEEAEDAAKNEIDEWVYEYEQEVYFEQLAQDEWNLSEAAEELLKVYKGEDLRTLIHYLQRGYDNANQEEETCTDETPF